ncbi:hypothetical protein NQ318_006474 [Aromia moschata]|uniref:Uncharacterized protein n=1 Tax=Aromia moschata TaxID=1265417 RepID=A0AAV8X3S1_9CUCU|nr:hypothetical protein NQ318_006474 [Aromia moschata]
MEQDNKEVRTVRRYLDETFLVWIGRGSTVPWPARSPDLTPLDFFVWGFYKTLVESKSETHDRIPTVNGLIFIILLQPDTHRHVCVWLSICTRMCVHIECLLPQRMLEMVTASIEDV